MKIKSICSKFLAITLMLFGIANTTFSVFAANESSVTVPSTFTITDESNAIFKADLDATTGYILTSGIQVITTLEGALLADNYKFVMSNGTNYSYSKIDGSFVETTDFDTAKQLAESVPQGTVLDLTKYATPTNDNTEYIKSDFENQILTIIVDDTTSYEVELMDLYNEFAILADSYYTAWNWSYLTGNSTDGYVGHFTADNTSIEMKWFSNIVKLNNVDYDITLNNLTSMTLSGEDKITNAEFDINNNTLQISYELGTLTDRNGNQYINSVSNIEIYGSNNLYIGSYSVFESNENGVLKIKDIVLPEQGTYRLVMSTPYMSYVSNYRIAEYELEITTSDLSVTPIEKDYVDIEVNYTNNNESAKVTLNSHYGNSYIYTFNGSQVNTEPSTTVVVEVNENGDYEYIATKDDNTIKGYYFVSCFTEELDTVDLSEMPIHAEELNTMWLENITEKLWQTGLYYDFNYRAIGIICIVCGLSILIFGDKKIRNFLFKRNRGQQSNDKK